LTSVSLGAFVKIRPIASAVVVAMLLAGGAAGARPAPVRIGVVLNSLDNPFFVAIYDGVSAEAARRGARASVRAPAKNTDLAGQAADVRALVHAGQDCFAIAPITATSLVAALRGVHRPIVVVNSPIDRAAARKAGLSIRTYIGSSDFGAGKLGGAKMASLLHGTGDVALLGGWAGNVNSKLRLSGFERGIEGTSVTVVARANADYARITAEVAATQILRAHPRLSGFFAANDLMALGVADAVRATGRTDVRIIGLDGIPAALDAIRAGSISASVSQYPYVMGRMGVEACLAAARGAGLPVRVDAPIAVVDKSNVGRATAMFPRPFRPYSDPYARLLRARR
jgi:ABC-type sugar transport system substrate-binding protein